MLTLHNLVRTYFDSALERSLETYQSERQCSKVIECR